MPNMLNDADLVAALRRHWESAGVDEDAAHEIYHEDAVLEFPQSGERFEGVHNFREWRRQYPAALKFHIRRITHRDDLVVAENLISYDGAPWPYAVSVMEFRGDRVARERLYVTESWEAPEWRGLGALTPLRTRRFPTPDGHITIRFDSPVNAMLVKAEPNAGHIIDSWPTRSWRRSRRRGSTALNESWPTDAAAMPDRPAVHAVPRKRRGG